MRVMHNLRITNEVLMGGNQSAPLGSVESGSVDPPEHPEDKVIPQLAVGKFHGCKSDGRPFDFKTDPCFMLAMRCEHGWALLDSSYSHRRSASMAVKTGRDEMRLVLNPIIFSESARRDELEVTAGAQDDSDYGGAWVRCSTNSAAVTLLFHEGGAERKKPMELQTKVLRWNHEGVVLVFKFRPDKEHKQYFKTYRAKLRFMRVGHPAVAPLAAMFEAATAGELHRKCEYKPQFWSDEVLGVAAPWVRPLRSPVSEYVHHAARYLHNQSYDLAKLEKELLSQASSTDKWFSKDDVERVMGPLLEPKAAATSLVTTGADSAAGASSPPPAAPFDFGITPQSNVAADLFSATQLADAQAAAAQRASEGFDASGKPGGPFTERAPPPGHLFGGYLKGCTGVVWTPET